jgi:hypothetical protein
VLHEEEAGLLAPPRAQVTFPHAGQANVEPSTRRGTLALIAPAVPMARRATWAASDDGWVEIGTVQYFTACTLDGFIADENNSLDWLFEVPHDADDHYWDQWFPGVGGLVMGATTYEWLIERYGLADSTERWREFYDARPGWVFTIANFRSFRASTSPSSKVMYGRPTPR